ncbi:hypothetical protein F53441_13843 [Fusarium austroafricanum]|uniref:N-acetyltransferase domain-containing protein n=1 Tax=Fusarium austroafricanum TaxID=2364996 RepID=A0A8H4JMN2_9HYPO|nr:hypothetical protein F53441_13843 [Fusarium austroafricanum]
MDIFSTVDLPKGLTIHHVNSTEMLERWIPSLVELLQSCVNDDPASSSIGFRAPLSESKAREFWNSLSTQLFGDQARINLLVLVREDVTIGTIQLVTHPKETHAHKVEVGKLLISEKERSHGLGRRLVEVSERFAREKLGKTMVLLDTATNTPARGFYLKLGYTEWGICPQYAESADGNLHDCSFFYKFLGNSSA